MKTLTLCTLLLLASNALLAQGSEGAHEYMSKMVETIDPISKEMWGYMSAVANSRSAKKIENKRTDLVKTVKKAHKEIASMGPYNEETRLRDSLLSYLTLAENLLNTDYKNIVDLEDKAEESYENMVAYLDAKQKAGDKLKEAAVRVDKEQRFFAGKYFITIVDKEDRLERKIKNASKVFHYYNQYYLVFFKSTLVEKDLWESIKAKDQVAMEKNRQKLSSTAQEGIQQTAKMVNYGDDASLKVACQQVLRLYRDEADKYMPTIFAFEKKKQEFEAAKNVMETKKKKDLTQEDVDRYNTAAKKYNAAVAEYNKTSETLNKARTKRLNDWENAAKGFLDKHGT